MPTSKKRTSRKSGKGKPRTPKEEAAQQPSGVVVALTPGPKGGEIVNFQLLGETTQRELPTLLREAAKAADAQLGL